MSAMDAIKRAPRWTWYIAGGVGLGAVAIRVYQGRDAESAEGAAGDGATAGDAGGTYPATTGSSPPGVIVPPIITGGDGGSIGELGAAFAALMGGTISDLTGLTAGTIDAAFASNQAWIEAFGQSNSQWVDWFGAGNSQWIDALAAAGTAPAPVAQTPTPVVVTVTPPPAPPVASPPGGNGCPASHPHKSARGCYKNCGHCAKNSQNGKWYRNHGHCYQDGTRVHINNEYPGGCP